MKMPAACEQYLIQIDLDAGDPSRAKSRGKIQVDVELLQRLLQGTGIELDAKYHPVRIHPQQQRFVVRGHGTAAAKQRAERMLGQGVKFFADGRVQAISAGTKLR